MNTWNDEPNKRAIAIIRRSSMGQKENTSAETQEREIADYCKQHGLQIIKSDAIIESAFQPQERKKYNKLMQTALKEGIKHILFYVGSRETRNLTDNEKNERLIKEDKIIVHHVSEKKVYWKGTVDSEFLLRDIQTSVNKNYSRENGTKVRDAYKTKAENGWWPYCHTPLGYVHSKQRDNLGNGIKGTAKLERDPNDIKIKQVQREFELRAGGLSYDEIRVEIIKEGFILPNKVKSYNRSTIEKRLKNELYYGYFHLTDDTKKYVGKHELIISEKIRNAVTATFKNDKRIKRVSSDQGLLADGWIRCHNSDCQRQLTYDPKTKVIKESGIQKTYHYYRCTNSRGIHEAEKSIPEGKIWDQFEKAVELVSVSDQFAQDVTDALNETHVKQRAAIKLQSKGFQDEIVAVEAQEDRIFERLDKGEIDKEMYQRQLDKCRKQKQDLAQQLEQINLQIADESMVSVQKVFELAINAKDIWKSMEREKRLQYLKQVCSNSTLDELTVRYELKKPFALLSEMKADQDWRRELYNFRTACHEYYHIQVA